MSGWLMVLPASVVYIFTLYSVIKSQKQTIYYVNNIIYGAHLCHHIGSLCYALDFDHQETKGRS